MGEERKGGGGDHSKLFKTSSVLTGGGVGARVDQTADIVGNDMVLLYNVHICTGSDDQFNSHSRKKSRMCICNNNIQSRPALCFTWKQSKLHLSVLEGGREGPSG